VKVAGRSGRPRTRPDALLGDNGYRSKGGRRDRVTSSSSTLLGRDGLSIAAGGFLFGMRALARAADTGPAAQQVLELVEDLVEGQAGAWAFGSRRRRVRKAWAAVTRVTWWCQPRQVRFSKWSRPRPCFISR
jgi:hypothetical protein